jgi:hypothetical protein
MAAMKGDLREHCTFCKVHSIFGNGLNCLRDLSLNLSDGSFRRTLLPRINFGRRPFGCRPFSFGSLGGSGHRLREKFHDFAHVSLRLCNEPIAKPVYGPADGGWLHRETIAVWRLRPFAKGALQF